MFALVLLLGLGGSALASDDHIVQPYSSHSREGLFVLDVEPLEASNFAGAHYRLLRSGEVAWEGTRAFTLDTAVVSDEGLVLGSALTREEETGRGQVTIWRIDVVGAAQLLYAVDRHAPLAIHGGRGPWVGQVWIDSEGRLGRVPLVDMLGDTREAVLTFDLESGERLTDGLPEGTDANRLWSSEDGMRRRGEVPDAPYPEPFTPSLLGKTRPFTSMEPDSDSEPVREILAAVWRTGSRLEQVVYDSGRREYWREQFDLEVRPIGEPVQLDIPWSFRPMIWSPGGPGEWLVATRTGPTASCMRLSRLGADGEVLSELRSYDLPTIEALEALDAERFVALGSRIDRYSHAKTLVIGVYTYSGELVWEEPLEGRASSEPLLRSLLAVRHEATEEEGAPGRIFVLRSHQRRIEVFSLEGERLEQRPLSPDAPSPAVSLTVTVVGGLLVGGFEPAGGATKMPTTRLLGSIDSAGWIWLRKASGRRFFGTNPNTSAVRVLDLPRELESPPVVSRRPSTTPTGRVLVARNPGSPILPLAGASLVFSPTGQLVDVIDHGLLVATVTSAGETANAESGNLLGPSEILVGLRFDASRNTNIVTCLDAKQRVLAQTNRRPNGDFFGNEFGNIDDMLVDGGGTIAVLEDGLLSFMTTELSGGSIVQLPTPHPDLLALAAPWALLSASAGKQLIHIETGRFYSVARRPELEEKRPLASGFSPEGDELWFVTAEPLELWRYSLPKTQ